MPTFDDLVDTTTDVSSDADLVGIAGYFLRKIEETHPFSTGELRYVIEPSLRSIPSRSLGAYPSQLADRDLFQPRDDGWDLTSEGLSYYADLVTLPATGPDPRPEDDEFITATPPDDDFYHPLVASINMTYRTHIYDATMVLSRKLFENLLIELLRAKVDMETELETFYIADQNRFQPFSMLIEEFEDRLQCYRPYIPELDTEFVRTLDAFRQRANANAHSMQVNVSRSEIEKRSDVADDIAGTLFQLRHQIQLAADVG